MQENTQVQTTPPLPGPTLVDQVNKALQTIATHFSGSNDPASIAWPYSIWADTGNGRLKMRNAAGTAWVDLCPLESPLITRSDSDLQWLSKPIGEPFPLWTHIPGVQEPPTGSSEYRFIKLTASDPYNAGVLTNETVTGSAPTITATAVIDYADSPINGQTVPLINTEQTILRPRAGQSGVLQAGAVGPHTHPAPFPDSRAWRGAGPNDEAAGPATYTVYATQVNTGEETRMRNRGAEYFMRIY